jgi:lysophospholipase L1-like esterase
MAQKEITLRLLLITGSVLIALFFGEVGLRFFSRSDIDGNIYIGKLRVKPFRVPQVDLRAKVEAFAKTDQSYFQYDPDLGWSIRPNREADGGFYHSNTAGFRSSVHQKTISLEPAVGILRIALFGDSFTHGSDVPFEDSWGAILEDRLNQKGVQVEVLNFGVPGYAIDQAFLRWRKNGKPFHPNIVLFGFQNSNVKRNMNLIRVLYSPDTGLIFSKPRFVLEDHSLRLVNVPALPPENLPATLKNIDKWELKEYEFFFKKANYIDSPLYASRLVTFAISGLSTRFSHRRKDYDFFAPDSMSRKLTMRIIQEFHQDVTKQNAKFVIVHLPTRKPLKKLRSKEALKYQGLLNDLVSRYHIIDPADELLQMAEKKSLDALFGVDTGHYSAIGNGVVGEAVAKGITAL